MKAILIAHELDHAGKGFVFVEVTVADDRFKGLPSLIKW